jgi:hypothetical protein
MGEKIKFLGSKITFYPYAPMKDVSLQKKPSVLNRENPALQT